MRIAELFAMALSLTEQNGMKVVGFRVNPHTYKEYCTQSFPNAPVDGFGNVQFAGIPVKASVSMAENVIGIETPTRIGEGAKAATAIAANETLDSLNACDPCCDCPSPCEDFVTDNPFDDDEEEAGVQEASREAPSPSSLDRILDVIEATKFTPEKMFHVLKGLKALALVASGQAQPEPEFASPEDTEEILKLAYLLAGVTVPERLAPIYREKYNRAMDAFAAKQQQDEEVRKMAEKIVGRLFPGLRRAA